MIREIQIKNFKSIQEMTLDLGRVNVLIGENGAGKSNILEAIAFAAAASQDKLENEFLAARGIRVTDPQFMRAAFAEGPLSGSIHITLKDEQSRRFECSVRAEEPATYTRWGNTRRGDLTREDLAKIAQELTPGGRGLHAALPATAVAAAQIDHEVGKLAKELGPNLAEMLVGQMKRVFAESAARLMHLEGFLVYSPENSALRIFQAEGQILPLGIKGEGLFAHLRALSSGEHRACLDEIIERLTLIDWFERFEIPEDLAPGERSLRIRDRYLTEGALFDQRSANEGFLLLLFYFTLFTSPDTPRFFAIDNIDASLNPKLCRALVETLVSLAEQTKRQVILSTHNPAALDGLDLNDDDQRLLVVRRSKDGSTKVRRVSAPKPVDGEPPIKLSEAFMRGYIGGLPKNF